MNSRNDWKNSVTENLKEEIALVQKERNSIIEGRKSFRNSIDKISLAREIENKKMERDSFVEEKNRIKNSMRRNSLRDELLSKKKERDNLINEIKICLFIDRGVYLN